MYFFKTLLIWAIVFITSGAVSHTVTHHNATDSDEPLYFNIVDTISKPLLAPVVEPWKVVDINDEYSGLWVVVGDVDNDGEIEVVSAKNFSNDLRGEGEYHYTSSVSVIKLDGQILWQWGNPEIGRKVYHHDVPCQMYDYNGDGNLEVVLISEKSLIIFEGKTGKIIKKYPVPPMATDCVIAANLSGKSRPMDFILKDRYMQMYGMDATGKILWKFNTESPCFGHRPLPVDITGNNTDEIFCGFFMLNSDGSLRWKVQNHSAKISKYLHMDSQAILNKGQIPEDWLFAFTYCIGNGIAIVNGQGDLQKEVVGVHYESISSGNIFPLISLPHLAVDIDHMPAGESIVDIFDSNLNLLGRINVDYGRYHALVDWDGDGYDDIVIGDNAGIYNYKGQKIAKLDIDGDRGRMLQVADFSGDKVKDILIVGARMDKVHIFKNINGKPSATATLGTGMNFTLY